MTSLDLIEFADLTRPTEIAEEILKQNPDIVESTPLEEIAHAAGIKEIRYCPLDNLEGALVANPTKSEGIIIVSDRARHHRQRFTLGHELGHFLIPRHGHEMNCSVGDLYTQSRSNSTTKQRIEAEANEFSAELLMPKTNFCNATPFKQKPSIEAINALSSIFDISFQACANRYVDLHGEPLAVVFSHNGLVSYSYRSAEIPFWLKVNKSDNIPFHSLTRAIDTNRANHITTDEVDSTLWFDYKAGFEMPESTIEAVFVQENGYVATLLWFQDAIEETED